MGGGRKDWEKRVGLWRRELKVKRAAEKTVEKRLARLPDVPPELLCPSWCKDFKSRNGVVPFEVLSIVPSPEQEVICFYTFAQFLKPAIRGQALRSKTRYIVPKIHHTPGSGCALQVASTGRPLFD